MKRKLTAATVALVFSISAFFLTLTTRGPAGADYRINWYQGQNPPSAWMMNMQRYVRLQFGAAFLDFFGGNQSGGVGSSILSVGSGLAPNGCCYTGLVLSPPASGLAVVVKAPTNGTATVWGFHADDTSGWSNGGIAALTADQAVIANFSLLNGSGAFSDASMPLSLTLSGLSAGTSSGQSLPYLIECSAIGSSGNPANYNNQTITLVSGTGVVTNPTQAMTYGSIVTCQAKAGTSSASPVVPSVDNAWVSVGSVIIPNATVNVTSGMISQVNYPAWPGFAAMSPGNYPTATNGIITNPASLALQGSMVVGGHFNQGAASQFATRHALASGSYTFTFPTAFNSTPVCVANDETVTANTYKALPSTTSCIITSSSGIDSSNVDIIVVGNPN